MRELFLEREDRRLFVSVGGDGPAFLFAHGLFGTHVDASWISQAAPGFTLIAPDLWGRGQSRPATSIEGHTFEAYSADMLAILDHLDIEKAVVGGTSFGAAVAVAFALRHPDRMRALILVASAFGALEDQMGEGDLGAYGDLADRIAAEGLGPVAASEAERTGSDRSLKRWTQHDEESLVAWLRAVPRYRPFRRAGDLGRVTMPTLVVPGEDSVHTPELTEAYARSLPQATLADPGSLIEAVRAFLEPFVTEAGEEPAGFE